METVNNVVPSESIVIESISSIPPDYWVKFTEYKNSWYGSGDNYYHPVVAMANCLNVNDGGYYVFPIINRGESNSFELSKDNPVVFIPKAKITRRFNSKDNKDGFYLSYI